VLVTEIMKLSALETPLILRKTVTPRYTMANVIQELQKISPKPHTLEVLNQAKSEYIIRKIIVIIAM
jgi:hypothetical protein